MAKTRKTQIEEVEAAQKALRESIERTKELAEKAENLVQQHKKVLKSPTS